MTQRWVQPEKIRSRQDRRTQELLRRVTTLLERIPELHTLLTVAQEASEIPGRRPTELDDPGIRSQGGPPSDLTYDVVTDSSRWMVSHAVKVSDRHLLRAIVHLQAAESVLVRALDRWDGVENQ